MSLAVQPLLTAEDFWLLPDTHLQRSLIRGAVIEAPPHGALHGIVAATICSMFYRWAKADGTVIVGGGSGFILARNPDTVRGIDAFFIRRDHLPAGGVPEGFWEGAPDLAVEVVEPDESAEEVREKVHDYLEAGTALVLVAYARTSEVIVHTPDGLARAYRGDDLLTSPEVLPGFSCKVSDLFE
jgi:Uma2 family endonuclease